MFLSRNKKKIMYTPVNRSFTIYKWGLRGSKLCFRDADGCFAFCWLVTVRRGLFIFTPRVIVGLFRVIFAFHGHLQLSIIQ